MQCIVLLIFSGYTCLYKFQNSCRLPNTRSIFCHFAGTFTSIWDEYQLWWGKNVIKHRLFSLKVYVPHDENTHCFSLLTSLILRPLRSRQASLLLVLSIWAPMALSMEPNPISTGQKSVYSTHHCSNEHVEFSFY